MSKNSYEKLIDIIKIINNRKKITENVEAELVFTIILFLLN